MRMNKKKTRPAGGTAEQAVETGTACRSVTTSSSNNSTKHSGGQAGGIASLLMSGSENGLHLQDLVRLTGEDQRTVRKMIHEERRQGVPILSDNASGYFLPGSQQELEACVRSLRHRAEEILAAAAAVERAEVK